MINIHNYIKEHHLKSKIILQVHDELILETPENELEKITSIVIQKMEGVIKLSVPITVEAKSGNNWDSAH